MSEDEMEIDDRHQPGLKSGVAIGEKHASPTVVVPSSSNEASPSSKVGVAIDGDGRSLTDRGLSGNFSGNLDKINNLVQKEIALGKVGVTREKAYRVIAQALDAMKWVDVSDEQGNIKREWVADLDKQRWGAEMAIKMFGDMIERKEIEHDIGDRTLDRLRSLSVAELKARAADLLLGRKGAIDAEVVK